MNITQEIQIAVYEKRRTLIDKVNSVAIFLETDNGKHKAYAAGSKLQWPIICSGDTTIEISWPLMERLASGETNTVII